MLAQACWPVWLLLCVLLYMIVYANADLFMYMLGHPQSGCTALWASSLRRFPAVCAWVFVRVCILVDELSLQLVNLHFFGVNFLVNLCIR